MSGLGAVPTPAGRTPAFGQVVPGELTSFFRFRGFPGLFSFCFRGPRFFFFTPRAPSRPRSSSSSPSAGTRQPEPWGRGQALEADKEGWLCEVPLHSHRDGDTRESGRQGTVSCAKVTSVATGTVTHTRTGDKDMWPP